MVFPNKQQRPFLRVMILIWADLLATYVMWIMQTYLTDVWQLGFTHAAGIMNIASGLPKALPLLFYCFVDAGLGNKWMLLLSSFSYVIGLGILSMSTPPVLAKATGTCKDYEPECIGHTQKALFYTALALIAAGISGHIVSLVPVFSDQFQNKVEEEPVVTEAEKRADEEIEMFESQKRKKLGISKSFQIFMDSSTRIIQNRKKPAVTQDDSEEKLLSLKFQPVEAMFALMQKSEDKKFRSIIVVLVPVIAIFALPYIKPWSLRFGIPAICSFFAICFFLHGFRGCKDEDISTGSPITNVLKVLFAATMKMFKRLPARSELYGNDNSSGAHASRALCCRRSTSFLDKAAIEEGLESRRWMLCTVTEVEETKMIISMVPVWITLILCGVVTSIGSTYFVEQANHMNYMLGKLKLPDSFLLLFYESSKLSFKRYSIYARRSPRKGIALATVCATLCCIVAALVEGKRRDVIRDHGLIDKPEERIPMTIFWLFPQYFLLAGLDSYYENSVTPFLNDHSPPSMQRYLIFLNPGLSGIGIIGSVLSVFVVGRVSERHGKPSWFQYNLNGSRLDRYFWTLAALSAANFIWFVVFTYLCPVRKAQNLPNADDEEAGNDEDETGGNVVENVEGTIVDIFKENVKF